MTEEQSIKKIEERKTKSLNFIKNNYILMGIMLLALAIRLYYFFITQNQTLWWDELCYGSLAKNLITHQWNTVSLIINETTIRPMLLPLLWSFLIRMDFPEVLSKLILEIVPSLFVILFIYLAAEKMYNKRIALISSFILTVSWMTVFYSVRFMTHIPGLLANLASIYFFFKATDSEKINFKYFAYSIFLLFISCLFRWNYGLVAFAYLLIIIVTYKLSFIKQKSFWLGGVIGSIPLMVLFTINLVKFNKLFPALSSTAEAVSTTTRAFAFYTFGFIPHILQMPFLIMFIIGLIIVVVQLFLGFDSISQIKKLKSHTFLLTILIINLFFLIFYVRYAEDRYLFECLISLILIIAISLDIIYEYIKKYNKVIAICLIVIFLLFGGYSQYKYGDSMIIGKKDSYAQMKDAFTWIKNNVPKDSVVMGTGIEPYTIYYSGIIPIEYYPNYNQSILNKSLKVDYFVHHAFTTQSKEYGEFLNSLNLTIVYISYFDSEKKNPAVIVARYN
jgi:hypothetical protein